MARRSIPPGPVSTRWIDAVRESLETLMGMRGRPVSPPAALRSQQLSGAPTQADFNALQADVAAIHEKLDALIRRSDGDE